MRASGLPNGKVSHASSTDRLQALGRSRRGVVLIVLAACTTCLLAAQAAAAWRRGPGGNLLRADGGSGDQRQLLHQLAHAPAPAGAVPNTRSAVRSGSTSAGGPSQAPPSLAAPPLPPPEAPAPRPPAQRPPLPAPPQLRRAVLRLPEVDDGSRDECAQALRLPRVALLFLTRGDLFHHETWAAWFRAARDQLPAAQLRAAACGAPGPAPAAAPAAKGRLLRAGGGGKPPAAPAAELPRIAAACGWNASTGQPLPGLEGGGGSGSSGGHAIDGQHLFSVYVHAPPDVKDKDLPEVFRGRLVTDRLTPTWGSHQLVEATRNLLWEAFRDPLNERFVLLSESDIPLYDPLTLHQQLLADTKSRINACWNNQRFEERWTWRMSSSNLQLEHWRKGGQWFGLLRRHVEVVLHDAEVFRRFEEHCTSGNDPDYKRWRGCVSDEHYIHTLLAAKGLADQTSCRVEGVAATDWSKGGEHPKSYGAKDVQPALIQKARGEGAGCDAAAAVAGARRMFVSKQQAFGAASAGASSNASSDGAVAHQQQASSCKRLLAAPPSSFKHPLGLECALTARKFPKDTAAAVRDLFDSCANGLHLLAGAGCAELPGGKAAAQQ